MDRGEHDGSQQSSQPDKTRPPPYPSNSATLLPPYQGLSSHPPPSQYTFSFPTHSFSQPNGQQVDNFSSSPMFRGSNTPTFGHPYIPPLPQQPFTSSPHILPPPLPARSGANDSRRTLPPISDEEDLPHPAEISRPGIARSEIARGKKRDFSQVDSDAENQPPRPRPRPRPRPLANRAQAASAPTSSDPNVTIAPAAKKEPLPSRVDDKAKSRRASKSASVKPRVKSEKTTGTRGGRKKGVVNYSTAEDMVLLSILRKLLPIGGKTWEVAASDHNEQGAIDGFPKRDVKSIRARYNTILKHALNKPTGDPDRGDDDPFHLVLEIEDAINEKAGSLKLDDDEFYGPAVSDDNQSVIDISSDEAAQSTAPSIKDPASHASNSTFVAAKSFKASMAPPPDVKPRRGSNLAAATNTLGAIGAVFNPGAMRDRDSQRLADSVQLSQLASTQAEIRELRSRIDSLQDRLLAETRRADKAETQLEMYTLLQGNHSRHRSRRRSPSPSSTSDSYYAPRRAVQPPSSRHRRHAYPSAPLAPLTSPSPQPIASSSRVRLEDLPVAHQPIASSSRIRLEDLPMTHREDESTLTLSFTPRKDSDGKLVLDVSPTPKQK